MTLSVFIDGAVGTTGLEIGQRLAGRGDVALIALGDERRKDASARREALNDADLVILCLPDDAAREAVALIANKRTRVIDASTAHRVASGWVYGFSELEPDSADRIADARFVANPGCYPTAYLALIRPLVRAGLIARDAPLSFHATSGYSGGGKAMIAAFESGGASTAFRAYALDLAHKHAPEMQAHSGLDRAPIFAAAVADTCRGMIGEVPLHLDALTGKPRLADLTAVLHAAYADQPLVIVTQAQETAVTIEADAGTDRMTLRICGNEATGQARLIATLDNLGKGAAGAAVQNLNLMAGFAMTAGLIL